MHVTSFLFKSCDFLKNFCDTLFTLLECLDLENSPANSSTTGAHYSQPRKPTSVVELPSAPIQPQFYSSNAHFQKFNNEHPPTPTGFDNFQPLKSSTPKYNGSEYVTPQQFFATTTTFGTEPQRKSTFISENNAFSPDESHTSGF
uniref:Uncharacterized protein n=1 Tax=Panagrolaimus davidi TaxID=227884 RepID=A0A914Q314_9BILA